MTSRWTGEQLAAITARDCNLLVSAAAGAGKTAVLVERIIRKITDVKEPLDIDKLLVVTFTKAAAAEMRERISTAIAHELNKNPESRHLNRQMTLLNRASITTIHSFCLDVLRQYFHCIDLDPVFRVADDTEAALLRMEALEETFEDYYANGPDEFFTLVDAYGGDRNDSYLQEMVLRLYQFAASTPWPSLWLRRLSEDYARAGEVPLESLPWGQTIMGWVELQFQGCRVKLDRALKLASSPGGPAAYTDNLVDDINLVNDLSLAAGRSWMDLYNSLKNFEFSKLKRCLDKGVDEQVKNKAQKMRDDVKKTVNNVKSTFFSRPPGELADDLKRVAPLVETLAGMVTDFTEKYRKAKSNKSLVDFSDLEQFCLQVLTDDTSTPDRVIPSMAACELREHFNEILVDEYQDINGVQETILQLVSREGTGNSNRFMVGDVKQSIYRFRLAEPALFMDKYSRYPRVNGSAEQGIDLTRNFRSRGEVVAAVNYLFRQLMTARVGEIVYDSKAELVCGAEYLPGSGTVPTGAGPTELYILEKNFGGESPGIDNVEPQSRDSEGEEGRSQGEEGEDDLDAVQREARLVAYRIRDLVTGSGERQGPEIQVFDKNSGGYRPVRYRDIVVLLRATRNAANTFMEEFRTAGVPAYADLNTGYFEVTEVETIMSLLKVIDNPRQDIPLAALLRSPIVGLNAEELGVIRLRDTRGDFYDAVRKSAEAGETAADLKLRELLDRFEGWRTMARQGPLSELIWQLYNETGYYAYVGGMPGGTQRQANLRAFHDRARQYEATTFRGLFRFLRFIEKFQETGNDLGSARAVGENEDVVRVLSIHKSKGLEFPVVIVAGLGKQFNTNDLKKKALFHKELGLGLPFVDPDLRLSYPTIAKNAIARKLHMELLAEEMRILYVALTRAREKLILVGSVNDIEKAADRWCENTAYSGWALPDTDLAAAKTFLDWIGPAVARHQDGSAIRQMAGCDAMPAGVVWGDQSGWQVFVNGSHLPDLISGQVAVSPAAIESVRQMQPVETEEQYGEFLDKRLNWRYPFIKVVGKPAKASVTELKRRFALEAGGEEPPPPYRCTTTFVRPRFLQQSTKLSLAERGTAMHLFMQHLKLNSELTEASVREQLAVMVETELLTGEQAGVIDLPAVQGFIRSPLGQRVIKAARVSREVPFTMVIPAYRMFSDLTENYVEQVMVQGVIDCLIDEGDGYIIIDYKTDSVSPENVDEMVERYQEQLSLYAEAVETILRRPVKEKYLYLFSLGREVKCG